MKVFSTGQQRSMALALAALILGSLWPSLADAQVRRRSRPEPTPSGVVPSHSDTMPGQTVLPQATPAQPPAPPNRDDTARRNDTVQRDDISRMEGTAQASHTKIVRGNQLIGLQIWDSENQQVGVVKDFFIENTGNDCPTIYLATSPVGFGPETYVIVPFNTLRVHYDANRRSNYFVINMRVNELRDAPHIRNNNWDVINRGEFLTNARMFYRQIERTATRPDRNALDGRNLRDDNRGQNLRDDDNQGRSGDETSREPRPEPRMRNDSGDQGDNNPRTLSNVPPPPANDNDNSKNKDAPKNTDIPKPPTEKSDTGGKTPAIDNSVPQPSSPSTEEKPANRDRTPPTDQSPPKTPPPPAEKNPKSDR